MTHGYKEIFIFPLLPKIKMISTILPIKVNVGIHKGFGKACNQIVCIQSQLLSLSLDFSWSFARTIKNDIVTVPEILLLK